MPDHVGVRPSDEGLAVRHRLLELLGVEDRLEVVGRVEGHHREGVGALVAVDREDVVLAQAGEAPGDRDMRVAIVGDELLGRQTVLAVHREQHCVHGLSPRPVLNDYST